VAIELVLHDGQTQKTLGRAGREKAEREFREEVYQQRIAQLIEDVATGA
jgi:glycosyltransferase involved in cell wall biosynthesis